MRSVWGDSDRCSFRTQHLVAFQEISVKFLDHHRLTNKLLLKRLPAGLEQKRENPKATHWTESRKQGVFRSREAAQGAAGPQGHRKGLGLQLWLPARVTNVHCNGLLMTPQGPALDRDFQHRACLSETPWHTWMCFSYDLRVPVVSLLKGNSRQLNHKAAVIWVWKKILSGGMDRRQGDPSYQGRT